MKNGIIKGAVAATAMTGVLVPGSAVGATTTVTDGKNGEQSNDLSNPNGTLNQNGSTSNIVKDKSKLPEVPYFYYWTDVNRIVMSWDFGHVANRPSKIEAIIDSNLSFSNPSYINVKAKGAEFTPNIEGDFYLRVRFYDSAGNVTHESVRKVIRGTGETREIKGLKYETSGTGVKLSWNNFTSGIKSGQVFVNGKLYGNLSESDIKSNSTLVQNVAEGAEIKVRIVGNNGLEYNGVVFVEKGSLQSQAKIGIGLSSDGVGLNLDLSKTSFTKGSKFNVKVSEKGTNGEVIVSGTAVTLDKDSGSLTVYPDKGKTFKYSDYLVTVTNLDTGEEFVYEYSNIPYSVPDLSIAGLADGKISASWSKISSVVRSTLLWSTREDFSDAKSIDLTKGESGTTFDTGIKGKQPIYLMLINYDSEGRIVTYDVQYTNIGSSETKLNNFKGTFKEGDTAEFSWKKLENVDIVSGILKVNDKEIALTQDQISTINNLGYLFASGFTRGQKYNVALYLVDKDKNVYSSSTSSISSGSQDSEGVTLTGVSGLSGKYLSNPGIVTLSLDESAYDIVGSSIGITVGGQKLAGVSATYVPESGSINIKGLVPTKLYKNVVLTYTSKSGESKTIEIESLIINSGGTLDSFLVNAYNKAISRDVQNIDEEGYTYWKNGLLNKSITLGYFIKNFAYVPEFMSLVNSPDDLINRLYNVLVLRDPDAQGLQFWKSVYTQLTTSGVSHNEAVIKILSDMTTSSEFSMLAQKIGVSP